VSFMEGGIQFMTEGEFNALRGLVQALVEVNWQLGEVAFYSPWPRNRE